MTQAIDLRFSLRTSLSPLGEFQRSFELLARGRSHRHHAQRPGAPRARVHLQGAVLLVDRPAGPRDRGRRAGAWPPRRASARRRRRCSRRCSPAAPAMRCGDYAQRGRAAERVVGATDDDRANFLGMANLPSVSARTWLSWSLAERGEFAQPRSRAARKGCYIADTVDHLVSRIYGYMALGIAHLRKGDLALAISNLQRAFQFSETENLRMCARHGRRLPRPRLHAEQPRRATRSRSSRRRSTTPPAWTSWSTRRCASRTWPRPTCTAASSTRRDPPPRTARSTARRTTSERGAQAWAEWLLGEIHARAPIRRRARGALPQARSSSPPRARHGAAPRATATWASARIPTRQAREHRTAVDTAPRSMPFWPRQAEALPTR